MQPPNIWQAIIEIAKAFIAKGQFAYALATVLFMVSIPVAATVIMSRHAGKASLPSSPAYQPSPLAIVNSEIPF